VADAVDPALRPRAFLDAHRDLDSDEGWSALCELNRGAYGRIVLDLCASLPDPSPGRWVRTDRGRFRTHAGEGVLVTVVDRHGRWELYTAFRRFDFRLKNHDCPPRDTKSVSLRRKMAAWAAERWLASRTATDDEKEGLA
jgi:hypothetical protein